MKKYLPLLLTLLATPALAHDGSGHVHSLASGLLHPLTGLDHLSAMLATGFIGSRFGGFRKLAVAGSFLAAMIGGYGLALTGISLPVVETMILASVVVLGAFCLVPQKLVTAMLFAAGFAVFHGYAHGAEASSAAAMTFGLGFIAASAALMGLGMGAGELARIAREHAAVIRR